jgi:toxin YoeB
MILSWTEDGWQDYLYWQNQGDKKTIRRINILITDTKRHPFEGLGKPEGLKNQLSGFWSRRIDSSNRLIYTYSNKTVTIYSCKDHY